VDTVVESRIIGQRTVGFVIIVWLGREEVGVSGREERGREIGSG
jgi:hypothetical protein